MKVTGPAANESDSLFVLITKDTVRVSFASLLPHFSSSASFSSQRQLSAEIICLVFNVAPLFFYSEVLLEKTVNVSFD